MREDELQMLKDELQDVLDEMEAIRLSGDLRCMRDLVKKKSMIEFRLDLHSND